MKKHNNSLFYTILLIFLVSLNGSYGQLLDDRLPAGVIEQFKHGDSVYSVAISPDGKLLASSGHNNEVILWNIADRKKRKVFTGPSDSVMSVVFSPDGKLLASASLDGFVRLWDVASESRHKTFSHGGWVKSVAFSADGKTLASGGGDQNGSVMLWDVNASQNHHITTFPGHNGIVESVAFSSDRRMFATASRDRTVKIWDIPNQQMHKNLTKHVNVVCAAAFSPDGKLLATTSRDNSIILWNVSSGETIAEFKIQGSSYVYAEGLAFSPDGKYLALACKDQAIRLWNVVERRQAVMLRGHGGAVTSVAFSRDGRRLVSGSRDRTVLLWDLSHFNIVLPEPTPDPVPTPHPDPTIIVVDTKPPNIDILAPTGSIVPPETEHLPVRGEVTDENGINVVKVNGKEVWVSANGVFTATVPLTGGENDIRVTATDIYENMGTKRFTVERPGHVDTDPPIITLDEHIKPKQQSDNSEFTVSGSVNDDNSIREVKINGQKVSVSGEGRFDVSVKLTKTVNKMRVEATDTQGNLGTNRFTVTVPNPPPIIRIIKPRIFEREYSDSRGLKHIITITEESVSVQGKVKDDDGISEVKVNGKKVDVNGEDFKARVSLTDGDNTISVIAKDLLGKQSEKKIIVYHPPNNRTGKDYALLFAVNDYIHWPNLRYPISDAENIKQDLENIYGFQTELIKDPTKEDIFITIRKYAEKIYDDDDQLFIFFAGHGYFNDSFKGGYLVARDTKMPVDDSVNLSYVSHSRIRDDIDSISCKHIFLVMDTCYSGTFDRTIAMLGNSEDLSKKKLTSGYIKLISEYTTRKYLTSGQNERVPDVSKFVHALQSALRSKGGLDGILTIDEILSFMNHLDNPKPHTDGFGQDELNSDFLFIAK